MPEFAFDETTGLEYIRNEQGEFVPFTDATGTGDAILINAGAKLRQLGRGISGVFGGDKAQLRSDQRADEELLAGLRQARPGAAFVGDMLPGLATLPIGGTAALAGQLSTRASLGISTGLGGLEGLLSLDPNAVSQTRSTLQGITGGVLGEGLGRMAGRVGNAIMGMGSNLARSEASQALARAGKRSLPSEALNVPGQNIAPLQRMEQSAQSSILPPGIFREVKEERAGWMNDTASSAIGLPQYKGPLTPDVLGEADDLISSEFEAIAAEAFADGVPHVFEISPTMSKRLLGTKGQIKELADRGVIFQGLDQNMLQGNEIMIARRALAQDAFDAASKGKHELAQDIFSDVDIIDNTFIDVIGDPELLARHATARQKYRNLEIMQGKGVINAEGDVAAPALKRKLAEKGGYGKTFTQNRDDGLLPETAELFDVTRTLADPVLAPFRSSGTAENQSFGRLLDGGLLGGSAQLVQSLLTGAVAGSPRGANIAGGLLVPGGSIAGRLGGEAGPSVIDQLLAEQFQQNQQ